MKKPTKQELRDRIDYLEKELKNVQDDLDAVNMELYEICRERDLAEAKLEELENRLYGDRGSD
jgi:septal ring factor EnvC (AmiA/AmiB activator)